MNLWAARVWSWLVEMTGPGLFLAAWPGTTQEPRSGTAGSVLGSWPLFWPRPAAVVHVGGAAPSRHLFCSVPVRVLCVCRDRPERGGGREGGPGRLRAPVRVRRPLPVSLKFEQYFMVGFQWYSYEKQDRNRY